MLLPNPSGTVDQAERQTSLHFYSGILADSPVVPTGGALGTLNLGSGDLGDLGLGTGDLTTIALFAAFARASENIYGVIVWNQRKLSWRRE